MQSVAEAVRRILEQAIILGSEQVSLGNSLFRTLARDLVTSEDSPRFDKAMMDGFVVNLDFAESDMPEGDPLRFDIVETITAGRVSTRVLHQGEAAHIMTGSPIPQGGQCVVPVESALPDPQDPGAVLIPLHTLKRENHILRRGAIARSGTNLLRAGCRLQPQQLAAIAESGFSELPVSIIPKVAVLATGDELVDVGQTLPSGMIRNSNEPMLLAQVKASGADGIPLGIARDSVESLQPRIAEGLKYDVLLLSGGVSAGIMDLVPSQLAAAGVQQIFHGVKMKPGKPLWFGILSRNHSEGTMQPRRTYVFGLPGNPVSSLACFELFVRPLLQMLQGQPATRSVQASLTTDFSIKGDRPVYQPSLIFSNAGKLAAQPIAWSSSSDLKATVEANGMIELLPEHGPYQSGHIVEAWLWGDQRI
ncbi:MAG: molybdopterin molybdotransferase MoeA [Planctomycetota bacterium]